MSDEVTQEELNSWGNEDESKVQTRYLRLKKSEKGTKLKGYSLGDFVVIADKNPVDHFNEAEIVILEVGLGRLLQSPYTPGKDRVTFCRSKDRITPVTDDNRFTPKATDCASCEHGQRAWANYKTTKQKPANPCDENATLVFALANDPSTVYIYNLDRERKVVEDYLTLLRGKSKAAIAKFGRRPHIFEFVSKLTSATNAKDYWEPVLEFVGLLESDEVQDFRTLFDQRKKDRAKYEGGRVQETADAAVAQVQQQIVQEITPAQAVAAATAERPTYTPPASKRVAGARPTYTPPASVATPVPVAEVPLPADVVDDGLGVDDIPF